MSDKNKLKEQRKYNNTTIALLYGKVAGHCTICNKCLCYDEFSHTETHVAEKAHIEAFSELGSRYNKELNAEEKNDYENLLLLCGDCHNKIDKKIAEGEYTVEFLKRLKAEKESKVREIMKCLIPQISYCVKMVNTIEENKFNFDNKNLLKECYKIGIHVNETIINLCNESSKENDTALSVFQDNFDNRLKPLLNDGYSGIFCVFALAPQYILIKLGYEFSDKVETKIFTKHRDGWVYDDDKKDIIKFTIKEPKTIDANNKVALVVNSTSNFSNERIRSVLGSDVDVWSINASKIGKDLINRQEELKKFSNIVVEILDKIGIAYGKRKIINLFPAMCNSLAIAFGKSIYHKSQNRLQIYDTHKNKEGEIEDIKILSI